jgi:hypothetical protein
LSAPGSPPCRVSATKRSLPPRRGVRPTISCSLLQLSCSQTAALIFDQWHCLEPYTIVTRKHVILAAPALTIECIPLRTAELSRRTTFLSPPTALVRTEAPARIARSRFAGVPARRRVAAVACSTGGASACRRAGHPQDTPVPVDRVPCDRQHLLRPTPRRRATPSTTAPATSSVAYGDACSVAAVPSAPAFSDTLLLPPALPSARRAGL